jgi:hypothetical protein
METTKECKHVRRKRTRNLAPSSQSIKYRNRKPRGIEKYAILADILGRTG